MTTWSYKALNPEGNKARGNIEADSAKQARQLLKDQGLYTLEVQEGSSRSSQSSIRISLQQRALFTRQLATMVESGLPLDEILHAIARQAENAKLSKVILGIRDYIMQGHGFAEALKNYPKTFDMLYCSLVEAGEQSGSLATVLRQLADHEERTQQLQSKIRLALLYPSVLTIVAIGVIILLMTYVVPKVVEQFAHVNQTLPTLTKGLIWISDNLVTHGWKVLLGLVLTIVLIQFWLRKPQYKLKYHALLLNIPVLANFLITQQSFLFARTLGILTRSGLDLLQSLKIAAMPVTNLKIQNQLKQVTEQVREGATLTDSLKACCPFPPILIYMIQSGEQSGELDQMLLKGAEHQEMNFENKLAWLIGLFEPLIILLMGVVVLLIVLAILLPILEMNNLTNI